MIQVSDSYQEAYGLVPERRDPADSSAGNCHTIGSHPSRRTGWQPSGIGDAG